jgi:hypothetical protein
MRKILSVLLFGCMAAAHAAIVSPTSYDIPNGYTGSFNYWDESYNGSGSTNVDGAALTGGLGDLTDGVLATDNWFVVEAPAGAGPYVGWTINPTLIFHFSAINNFTTVRIHFDDANGNGGVSTPASVDINGTNYVVPDPAGSAPFSQTFDVTGLSSDTLTITLNRNNVWVFTSEFEFASDTSSLIPEPSTFIIAATGLFGITLLRRRRSRWRVFQAELAGCSFIPYGLSYFRAGP